MPIDHPIRVLLSGLVLFVALVPGLAQACRCVEPTTASVAYRRADQIVEATVLEVTPRDDIHGFQVKLKVTRVWKADVPEEISFITGTTCLYEVQPQQKYLLFLRKAEPEGFTTSRCMGNGLVTDKAGFLTWLTQKGRLAKVLPKPGALPGVTPPPAP